MRSGDLCTRLRLSPKHASTTSSNQQAVVPVGNNVIVYIACRSGRILGGGHKGAWFCPRDADTTKNKRMGATCLSGKELIRLLKAIPGVTQVETQTFTFMSM